MSTTVEVFEEITCPFAYVGLQHVCEHIDQLDHPVEVIVHGWPLEWVNGTGLAFDGVETKAAALCEQLGVDDFAGLDADTWPSTTLPALGLAAAAYRIDNPTGLAVSVALRTAVFEEGRDISDPTVLADIAAAHGVEFDPDDETGREELVRADYDEGLARSVTGSPHFWIGDDDFFCPALDLGRDADDHLIARFDPAGLAQFFARLDR